MVKTISMNPRNYYWKNVNEMTFPNKSNSNEMPWDIGKSDPNLDWVLKYFNLKQGYALDLGCGVGNDSNYLQQLGFEVDAIDLNPKFIETAKNNNNKINFICGDVFQDIPHKKYDLIYDRGFLHNMEYNLYPQIFHLLSSKLSTNGKLIIITGHPFPKFTQYTLPPKTPIHEIILNSKDLIYPNLIKEIKFLQNKEYDDNLGMIYVFSLIL